MGIQKPLVSVILPVYNRPERVCQTIKSILEQTYDNLELIVIDNASTDSTVMEIKKIKDGRIRLLVNEKNMGQTYSLNRGLREAKGKYILRIDSDDIAVPDRIEKQVLFLEQNQDYVLCGSWVRFIDENDNLFTTVRMCSTDEGLRFMQTFSCGMYHPTAVFRKETIDKYNILYDETLSMAEDYDLWARLLQYGRGRNLPEVLVYYRRGSNNDSMIHAEDMGRESCQIRKRINEYSDLGAREKQKIFDEIGLENKKDKSFHDMVKVCRFYRHYLNSNFKRQHPDYHILRTHMLIKVYASCISGNSRAYAKLLKKVYVKLKDQMRK